MIMRSRKLAIIAGLLLAATTSVPAFAQSAPKEPYPAACTSAAAAQSDNAHRFYEFGKGYYDEGNYEQAIVQFREAYKRDCSKHDLLIIISRAYELKGDRPEAIRALEMYVERVPSATTEHRTKIENLKKDLAKQLAAAAAAPPLGTSKPVEMREHTVPPWLVVGAGGIAIIAGIVVIATAPSLPEGCATESKTCTRIPDPDGPLGPKKEESEASFRNRTETAGTAKDQPIYGVVVIGAGAAIVIGGLLWHFLEPTGPVEASSSGKIKPKMTPQVAPGYAGLSLGATF
jgi:hypothetical protein